MNFREGDIVIHVGNGAIGVVVKPEPGHTKNYVGFLMTDHCYKFYEQFMSAPSHEQKIVWTPDGNLRHFTPKSLGKL